MEDSLFYRVIVSPDGSLEYDLSGDLSSIVWEQRYNSAAQLTLTVPDPFKVMGHALREGMHVAFELGTDTDHPLVFRGIVYTIESRFPPAGIPQLTLKAYDGLKELGMHRHSPTQMEEPTLGDIVREMMKNYKFASSEVSLSSGFTVQEAQMNQTDLEYLLALCAEHQCMMFVEPRAGSSGDFVLTDAKTRMQLAPDVTLSYGRLGVPNPMLEFEATVDAESLQVPQAVGAVEFLTGKPLDRIVRKPDEPLEVADPFLDENLGAIEDAAKRAALAMLIQSAPAAAETIRALRLPGGEAEAAEPASLFTNISENKHRAENWVSIHAHGMAGDGRTGGTPGLRAHAPVQIDDVGGRFSGKWFLTEVRHIIGRDGYHTEFSCRR